MAEQPMTWTQVREAVAAVHYELEAARDAAREAVLSPPVEMPANTEYRNAYADLLYQTTATHAQIEKLLERLAEAPPPGRSLQVVLAEIEAEGHEYEIHSSGWAGRAGPSIWSRRQGATWKGGSVDEHRRWVQEAEQGECEAGDVVEAAEKRLAEIRALHAEKLAEAPPAPPAVDDGPALDALLDAYTDQEQDPARAARQEAEIDAEERRREDAASEQIGENPF